MASPLFGSSARGALFFAGGRLDRREEPTSRRVPVTEISQMKARISGASARPEISAIVVLTPPEDQFHSR